MTLLPSLVVEKLHAVPMLGCVPEREEHELLLRTWNEIPVGVRA